MTGGFILITYPIIQAGSTNTKTAPENWLNAKPIFLWMCAQPLSNICTTVSENWQKNTWK
jgi:hypothetical protein